MHKLCDADKSELVGETKAFCAGCESTVADKKVIWDGLFGSKYDDCSLNVHSSYCAGLRQVTHLDLMRQFDSEFFDKIFEVVITKPNRKAETVYTYLQPNIVTEEGDITKFENLLKKV